MSDDHRRGGRSPHLAVVDLGAGAGSGPDPIRELIARGMHALHEHGDLRTSRRWFEEACRAAEEAGDRQAFAEAATGLGGLWVHEHRHAATRARVQSWQERALAVAAVGSDEHLLLRARAAAEADYLHGRHQSVLAVLAEARGRADPRLPASVLSLAHHCLLGPEHAGLRAELAQELLSTAARTDRRADRLMGLLWRSVDLFMAGDPHAGRSLAQLSTELEDADHLAVSFAVQAIQVMLTTRAGDFDRAEKLAGECVAAGEICGDADASGWYRGQVMAIRWFQGRIAELLPMLTEQVHAPELSAIDDSLIAALAVAAATVGDHREAAGALARLGHGDLTELSRSSVWLVTLYGAVEAAALLTDRDAATTAYALLKPVADLPMTVSLAVTCFGSVELALGVASLTTGHTGRAVAHLRRAVRANLALKHWPATCLSRNRLAQALAQRDGPGDRAEAERERSRAQQEARDLGMVLPPDPDPGVGVSVERAPVERRTGERTTDRTTSERTTTGTPGADPAVEPLLGRPARARPKGAQISLLGPLEVRVDGVMRPVPGHRRRTVLAVLALQAGEVVGVDRLIDIVWGERPPRTAVNTLQSHVSFLRRVIGDGAGIVARPPGYRLDLGDDRTDVATAEELVRTGLQGPDQQRRADHLRAALTLWRGRPLIDVTASWWVDQQVERIDQLQLRARQELAEICLALGKSALLARELQPLIREHPLAERLHAQLMLALYRDGRQGEALAVYRRLRSVLSAELGVEPTEPVRQLHLAILRQDPDL